jgi:hypothetical protein
MAVAGVPKWAGTVIEVRASRVSLVFLGMEAWKFVDGTPYFLIF